MLCAGTWRSVRALRVEIISIGEELVRGETDDRNGPIISRALSSLGMTPEVLSIVGDDEETIVEAFRRSSERSDLVLVSGGLGENLDDRVRSAATNAFVLSPEESEHPQSHGILSFVVSRGSRSVRYFLLPGAPVEMELALERWVLPELSRQRGEALYTARLRTFGLGAADASDRLKHLADPENGISLGIGRTSPEVEIVIRSRGAKRESAAKRARAAAAKVCTELGHAVHGPLGETLAEAVGSALRARRWTLSVLEMGTGGLLGARLTEVVGSSAYLLADIASVSDEVLEGSFGLGKGVSGSEDLLVVASKVRERSNTSVGLVIRCVAGPIGGSPESPVGLVHFALAGDGGSVHDQRRFTDGDRVRVRSRAVATAMSLILDYCREVAG